MGEKPEPNWWIVGGSLLVNSAVCQSHAGLTRHTSACTSFWWKHTTSLPQRHFIQRQREIIYGLREGLLGAAMPAILLGIAGKCADYQGWMFEPNLETVLISLGIDGPESQPVPQQYVRPGTMRRFRQDTRLDLEYHREKMWQCYWRKTDMRTDGAWDKRTFWVDDEKQAAAGWKSRAGSLVVVLCIL